MSERRPTTRWLKRVGERAREVRERGPSRAVLTGTTVAFAVLTAVVLRYVPEYLRVLGVGPTLIGAFGSVGIAASVVYTYWRRRRAAGLGPSIDADGTTGENRVGDSGSFGRLRAGHARAVAIGAATVALALWILAPSLTASTALVWVTLAGGLVLLCPFAPLDFDGTVRLGGARSDHRARRGFEEGENSAAETTDSETVGVETTEGEATGVGPMNVGVTGLGLPAGFLVVAGVLALVPTFLGGFQLLAALGVALGLVVLALHWGARDGSAGSNTEDATGGPDSDPSATGTVPGSLAAVRADLRTLSDPAYRLLLGDTLCRATSGAVSVFLVITVTTVLGFGDSISRFGLRPDALFAVLVATEALIVLASRPLAARLDDRIGAGPVAAGGALAISLVPIVLVNAPASPVVLIVVFGAYGLREAGRRAIERLAKNAIETTTTTDAGTERWTNGIDAVGTERTADLAPTDGDAPPGSNGRTDGGGRDAEPDAVFASYRLVRDVAVIPSALVGGALFAVSPQLAFGLATAIGLLGTREVLSFCRPRRR